MIDPRISTHKLFIVENLRSCTDTRLLLLSHWGPVHPPVAYVIMLN